MGVLTFRAPGVGLSGARRYLCLALEDAQRAAVVGGDGSASF